MQSSAPPTFSGRRVLVIDDSRVVRMLLRIWLERLGCEVTEANDGAPGLAHARSGAFELVFCDVNMPGLSGLSVLDGIRRNPGTAELPVILVTTRGQRQDRLRAEQLGVSGYITKPVRYGNILRALVRHLSPRR